MALLEDYLTEEELVAAIEKKIDVGCVRTLRSWRQRRLGPPWAKIGRQIIYPRDGVEQWLRAQLQQPVRSRRAA